MNETEQNKKDLRILKALYFGNHLNNNELEKVNKLIYLLKEELKRRIK